MHQRGQPYTVEEYTDMIALYKQCGHNAAAASRLYAEQFPQRRHPSANVILGAVNREESDPGNVLPMLHRGPGQGFIGAPRTARTLKNEERVLDCLEQDPTRSIRAISALLDISYSTVRRIIEDNV